MIPTIEWIDKKNTVRMIDQLLLPKELVFLEFSDYRGVAKAIKDMNIRGAPAIGVAAAMGMGLAALEYANLSIEEYKKQLNLAAKLITSTRPTAINLFWAVERIQKLMERQLKLNSTLTPRELTNSIILECKKMYQEDIDTNRAIGKYGARILSDGDTVLTHCNAGSLATVLYGTALAPIRWAIEEEHKKIQVIADETRPWLQGARLTAYELNYDKIPVRVETDNMAALIMRLGKIQKIIVGADRIVQDAVFNKIGTYMVAIAAKYHKIPMYIAAPRSTLSLKQKEKDVTIEQRDGWFEIAMILGRVKDPIVPVGVECINYAFNATPMELITGIITEDGVFTPAELLKKYK